MFSIIEYQITHRCNKCIKGKYGKPFIKDKTCIMARHYKWMSFYTGYYDSQSILKFIPSELMWHIIMFYQYIRQ